MIFEGFFDFMCALDCIHLLCFFGFSPLYFCLSCFDSSTLSGLFVCFHIHGLLEIFNVLYCSVLQYTITSDMILNHNMWCYAILWYYMFQLITMYYMLLSHTMLFYYIMLYDIENQYTISYYAILCYYVILHYVIIHCSILD